MSASVWPTARQGNEPTKTRASNARRITRGSYDPRSSLPFQRAHHGFEQTLELLPPIRWGDQRHEHELARSLSDELLDVGPQIAVRFEHDELSRNRLRTSRGDCR